MNVFLGLKAETDHPPRMMEQDWRDWELYTARMKKNALQALTTEQAIEILSGDNPPGVIGEGKDLA